MRETESARNSVTTRNSADSMRLEILAKDSGKTLDDVEHLYDQEYAALAEQARIPNFISMLALRRVRYRLQSVAVEVIH